MEPGPTSNTGGHERQREQTRSTRRSMALTTSQRGDLYRLARFGSEPEREEASRLLLEDATAHLARLRSRHHQRNYDRHCQAQISPT
ncbi:hypothetical protein NFJ02_10g01150 [Pycnococcus provasolii]